jgi:hypothetical protein
MARVEIHVVANSRALLDLRAQQFEERVHARPELVLFAERGRSTQELFLRAGQAELDLHRVRLRMLSALLGSPSRGFEEDSHIASMRHFVEQRLLPALGACRPLDWVVLPEFMTSCEELEAALAEQSEAWWHPQRPSGGTAAEIALSDDADGVLAQLRRSNKAFDQLIEREPPDLVLLELGPTPYPGPGLSSGSWTRAGALTHLTRVSPQLRERMALSFGDDPEQVPPFGLSIGPGLFEIADEVWISAFGPEHAEAALRAFGHIDDEGHADKAPLAHCLSAQHVSIALDEAAAEDLLEEEGHEGLLDRYRRAGHQLTLHEGSAER